MSDALKAQRECRNEPSAADKLPDRVCLPILHFNDVYNLVPDEVEPIGGAGRFQTAVTTELANLNAGQARGGSASCVATTVLEPLVFFSGDALSPSSGALYYF